MRPAPSGVALLAILTFSGCNHLLGTLTHTKVVLDGYGEIDAAAPVLSKDQALRFAGEIHERLQEPLRRLKKNPNKLSIFYFRKRL